MEGYMSKKGRGQSMSFIRPWATRFFVLDDQMSELRYYEKDNKAKCKGILNLKGVQVFDSTDGEKKYCFELHTQQHSGVLVLSAQDQAAKDSWMKAFSKFSAGEVRASMLAPGGYMYLAGTCFSFPIAIFIFSCDILARLASRVQLPAGA